MASCHIQGAVRRVAFIAGCVVVKVLVWASLFPFSYSEDKRLVPVPYALVVLQIGGWHKHAEWREVGEGRWHHPRVEYSLGPPLPKNGVPTDCDVIPRIHFSCCMVG